MDVPDPFTGRGRSNRICPETAYRAGFVFDLELEKEMRSVEGDIRDQERLWKTIEETKPELVFHLAAQPIVRESYQKSGLYL